MKVAGIFLIILLAICAVALIASSSDAQCGAPVVRTYSTPSYVAPTHVVPAAPVVEIPVYAAQIVPIFVPSFTVGGPTYQQPAAAVQAAPVASAQGYDCKAEVQSLRKEIENMRGQSFALNTLPPPPGTAPNGGTPNGSGGNPDPPKAASPAAAATPIGSGPHTAVMQKACASCHEKAVASSKGKSVVLFEGQSLAALAPETRLKVIDQVLSGEMPLGGKLTDQEIGSVVQGMTGRRVNK